MGQKKNGERRVRKRMVPEERRAQLLDISSNILSERGVEALRIPEVAEAAGVTRPVVYRFFPSRKAIFIALLEDLSKSIDDRLEEALRVPKDTLSMVRAFIDTVCDAIEECGPGAWLLLGGAALDEEVATVVKEIEERLSAPWEERVGYVLRGVDPVVVQAVTAMLVASSRAALGMWLREEIDRETAAVTLAQAVNGILRTFRRPREERNA